MVCSEISAKPGQFAGNTRDLLVRIQIRAHHNAMNAQWRCAHVRENTHDVVRESLRNLYPLVTTERLDPLDAGELTPKWRETVQSLNVGWFESSQSGIASGHRITH